MLVMPFGYHLCLRMSRGAISRQASSGQPLRSWWGLEHSTEVSLLKIIWDLATPLEQRLRTLVGVIAIRVKGQMRILQLSLV